MKQNQKLKLYVWQHVLRIIYNLNKYRKLRQITRPITGADIYRQTEYTYSNFFCVMKTLRKNDIINITKSGKYWNIILTHKGEEMGEYLSKVYNLMVSR